MDNIYTNELLTANLQWVQDKIAESAIRASRLPGDIQLVAVSKYVPYSVCQQLIEIGATDLGESRPQLLAAKAQQAIDNNFTVRWHQIGNLQTNKVKEILPFVTLIHSITSDRLLDEIQKTAEKAFPDRNPVDVLLEVNYEKEPNKTGVFPDQLKPLLDHALGLSRIRVRGFMTMAALESTPEEARKTFANVRELRDRFQQEYGDQVNLAQLSMGMSGDFPEAITEGATLVRVGSRLFYDPELPQE